MDFKILKRVDWFGVIALSGLFLCAGLGNLLAAFMWVIGLGVGFMSVALGRNND